MLWGAAHDGEGFGRVVFTRNSRYPGFPVRIAWFFRGYAPEGYMFSEVEVREFLKQRKIQTTVLWLTHNIET